MLSVIIIWAYIFLVCMVYGYGGAACLGFLLHEKTLQRLPLSLIIIFGLCLITTLLGYLSLFIKIGLIANLIILCGGLLLASKYWGEIIEQIRVSVQRVTHINKYVFVLLIIIFLFVLIKSTNPPSSFDTGLYHAQALRWLEEYRVVPGLGNLHGRLAFNSLWLLPNALFGFSFLKQPPCHVLNGFLLLILVLISLDGLNNLLKNQYNFTNILKSAVSLPAVFIFKDQLSSPTPDLPVALLICLLFIYYFQAKENLDDAPGDFLAIMIVILGVFAVTIKLTALPLLLLTLLLPGTKTVKNRPANILVIVGLLLLLLLPFLVRNLILSGYLIYPFPAIDWFNFDWKIPVARALEDKRDIETFARVGNATWELALGPAHWLPLWLRASIADYGDKLEKILLPALLLVADYLYKAIASKSFGIQLEAIKENILPYLVASAGIIFWFLTAPDPRFVFGFLIVLAIIIFLPFLKPCNYRVSKLFPWGIALLLLYFSLAFLPKDLPFLGQRLWLPAGYPRPSLAIAEVQGKVVYCPRENPPLCWYAPLPCTHEDPARFRFRGETLQEGFRAR